MSFAIPYDCTVLAQLHSFYINYSRPMSENNYLISKYNFKINNKFKTNKQNKHFQSNRSESKPIPSTCRVKIGRHH